MLQIRQGEQGVCLGEDQYLYVTKQQGDEMPQAVDFSDDDCAVLRELKQLILRMTSYRAADRPSSRDIVKIANALHRDVQCQVSIRPTLKTITTI